MRCWVSSAKSDEMLFLSLLWSPGQGHVWDVPSPIDGGKMLDGDVKGGVGIVVR